ncbi:unnamed protein product [Paramecium pentaurelia]|uniref:Uncharacterized protein n=1 Tax=Paramecium pentaurelia TaxID=43138 RepID=A0A8S1YH88_9CILI|nr:unnamed protein product [Paramecium pentaurelia]
MQQIEDQYVPNDEEYEQKDQTTNTRFGKFVKEQWEKIEKKNFSQFETRVLSTLQLLGNQSAEDLIDKQVVAEVVQKDNSKQKGGKQKKPEQIQPQQEVQKSNVIYEICVGQELYLKYLRPKLVEYGILSKIDDGNPKQEEKKQAQGKKGGKNTVKKEDLMRIELSKDKVNDQTMKMLQQMGLIILNQELKPKENEFLKTEQASKRIKSLKWMELKFSALMIYATQLIKCHIHSKFRDEYAFELIYFLKNVYLNYKEYEGQSYLDETKKERLASQAIEDLRYKLKELYKNFGFSNRVLFNKYPKLVIDTDLNQAFIRTDVRPYKSQENLLEILKKIEKPSLIFFSTMVGTGKTVLSVAIAQYLARLRESYAIQENNAYNQLKNLGYRNPREVQFLYCCPLDTVRTQVGAAAYERKLKFAIASMWKDSQSSKLDSELGYAECPRLVNSWQNRQEEFPTLVVADFKTTLELLKEKHTLSEKEKQVVRWQGKDRKLVSNNPAKHGKDYILFIDEPTVDADFADAEVTKILIDIIRRAPPITILSSATLPPPEKIPNFIKLYRKAQVSDIDIPVVHDSQFHIGCQVFSHSGHKFLPHYQAQNKQQLAEILDRLEKNPFMKRCYNANAYCELYDRMKSCGIVNIEDFETFDIITQEFVQRKSIELLKILLTVDDEIFKKVCSEKQDVVQQQQQDIDEQQQGEGEEQQQEGEEGEYEYEYEYVYEEVEDTGANNQTEDNTQIQQQQQKPKSKYIYTIEIDDEDKMKFTAPYHKLDIRQLGGNMAHKFLGGCLIAVNKPVEFIRAKFHKLLKKCAPASEYVKQYLKQHEYLEKEIQKKEREIDNEDERSKQIQALQESMKLTIAFPDFLKINTLEHYKKFVTNDPLYLEQYRARKAFSLEGINYQLNIPDDIMLYLFSGIAAYTEKQSELDIDYYEEVQKLASNGQLALIISDDSMCYGVNYPLNHVIVFDEMAEKRSIGALFQLIGRAGRVGVSWTANAYLGDKTFDRLIKYLNGQNEETEKDEAYNIEQQSKRMIQNLIELAKKKKEQQSQ